MTCRLISTADDVMMMMMANKCLQVLLATTLKITKQLGFNVKQQQFTT